MSLNRVILSGNIATDINLNQGQYGPFGDVLVICNDRRKTREGFVDDKQAVPVLVGGKTAELLMRYYAKGSPILLEGRLENQQWADKTTGQPRSKVVVRVERLIFTGQPKGQHAPQGGHLGGQPAQPNSPPYGMYAQQQPQSLPQQYAPFGGQGPPAQPPPDDIPF